MELRPYQRQGVKRLLRGSCLLADEWGLGKTVMAAVALRAVDPDTALIVCPLSMINTWLEILDQWYPGHGFTRSLGARQITNYEKLPDIIKLDVLILDESHLIKNRPRRVKGRWMPIRSKACIDIAKKARIRWLLTATPIMNRADEIWNQLKAVDPKDFSSYWDFAEKWCAQKRNQWAKSGVQIEPGIYPGREAAFAKMLSNYMLQRTKLGVGIDLPAVTEQVHMLDMTEAQDELYTRLMTELKVEVENGNVLTIHNILTRTIYARRCCVSPVLFGNTEVGAKFEALNDLLEGAPDKVVVFSQWQDPLLEFSKAYKRPNEYYFLYGSLTENQRNAQITAWRTNPRGKLLATIGTGGVGLTLAECNQVVLLDEPWNPAETKQAIGRLDRIGQTRPITVHYLRCKDSIEQHVSSVIGQKLEMVEVVNAELRRLK